MKVVIYTRISRDDKGDEAGVQRQEADCRKWCKEHGYEVVEVFCDNDISAMGGKYRPDYERMVEGIQARKFDAVVTWHQDRITRSPYEMEEYIIACGDGQGGMPTYTLNGGPLDLTTPEGRLQARFGVIIAQYYVEHNRMNNLRAKKQAREAGTYDMPSCFGWRRVAGSKVPMPVEAELRYVPRIHAEFQAGKKPADIAKDLTAEGVTAMMGGPIERHHIPKILRNPTHAGLTEYMGNNNRGRARGTVSEGAWEGVISRETWETSVNQLLDPTRRIPGQFASREYLLTGIMVCGTCGKLVTRDIPRRNRIRHVASAKKGSISVLAYDGLPEDEKKQYGKLCDAAYKCRGNHGQIGQEKAEAYVIPIVLRMIRESKSARNVARLASELKRIDAKLREIGDMFDNDEITRVQVKTMSSKLRDRRDVVEGKLTALRTPLDIGSVEWWDTLSVTSKRAVISETATITLFGTKKVGTRQVEKQLLVEQKPV